MKRWGNELTLEKVKSSKEKGEIPAESGQQMEEAAAKCLLLFSHAFTDTSETSPLREFECKTCNRRFPSFQALGGHRASHKRLRFVDEESGDQDATAQRAVKGGKPRGHECAICGLEFSIGQALGGHMRRHRNALEIGHHVRDAAGKSNGKKVTSLDLNFPPPVEDPQCVFG